MPLRRGGLVISCLGICTLFLLVGCPDHGRSQDAVSQSTLRQAVSRFLVVLYDPNSPSNGICVFRMSGHGERNTSTSTDIRNPNIVLMKGKRLTIVPGKQNAGIEITLHDLVADFIPFHPNSGGVEKDEMTSIVESSFKLGETDVLRINGRVISIRDAPSKYPSIP